MTIGSNTMIKEFEDSIVGMKKGEKKSIDIRFPKDYHNSFLAEKEVTFQVNVKKVETATLPLIDQDFINKIGIKCSVENFSEEVAIIMKSAVKPVIEDNIKKQIFQSLTKLVNFNIPKKLVDQEVNRLEKIWLNELEKRNEKNKTKINKMPKNIFTSKAEENIKIKLILEKIIKQENIDPDKESLDNKIKEIAKNYEKEKEFYEYVHKNKQEFNKIKNMVIENKVIEHIASQCTIEDEKSDFFKLVGSNIIN